jgi:GNAT superfamily N-acetyltransferase
VDPLAVRAAYDEQVRRNATATSPDGSVERDEHVTRVIGDGWAGVVWSDLDESNADAVIREQVSRFARLSRQWEWKHYSHDRPADLPRRLLAAGLVTEPAEALLIAEIADLALDVAPPAGLELVEVTGSEGAAALVRVHDEVFGGDHSHIGKALLADLARRPPPAVGVLAMAGSVPVSGGRVEFHYGTDFASLWGGGTLASWRGRGVFRSLVAYRAALASARGFRYLQVDASPDSRPILRRLGFAELATTTPFKCRAGQATP